MEILLYCLGVAPSQDAIVVNERLVRDPLITENVILVVTVTGRGPHQIYCIDLYRSGCFQK